MDLDLTGRTALVLGASAGLGLACAEALAGEGAHVVMFARTRENVTREATRIGATPFAGDVRSEADIQAAVQTAVDAFGGLDIVVANGGGPPPGKASEVTRAAAEDAAALLLLPVVTLVQAALPHLRASGRGRIVSIGSTSVREPIAQIPLSNAVRPGVAGYLKTLATELAGDGITVNTVLPGRMATARMLQLSGGQEPPPEALQDIPAKRLGRPRELGDVVAFLCSAQASYVTGSLIPIDGGVMRSF
jgi:3-oxoacyl-[acyl-carrier protein] reductase